MTLRIGSRSLGFTLIEVMLAAMALSLGALLIYQSFFTVLDAHNYCQNYFNTASWADEKMWQVQEEVTRLGIIIGDDSMGQFARNNKIFRWSASYYPIDEVAGLYGVDLVVVWQEGARTSKILRSGYAIYDIQQKTI